jgi:hypothetical protein
MYYRVIKDIITRMDEREWALAWARFNSLKANPPSQWSEDEVMKYHDILAALERVSGENLLAFRVADSELKQKPVSWTRGSFRRPATTTMSKNRYCKEQYMRQQMEGVVMYFENLQPAAKTKTIGF